MTRSPSERIILFLVVAVFFYLVLHVVGWLGGEMERSGVEVRDASEGPATIFEEDE